MGMRIEFLLVYCLLAYILLVGGLFGIDYVQDRLEAQSGAVVAKSYKAPKGGLIGSRGEVYRFEISDGSKKRFYNPVKQNKTHVKWLRSELGEDVPIFPVVAFSERCELKKLKIEGDMPVVKRNRLGKTVRVIWDGALDALEEERAAAIAARLRELADVTKEDKDSHVERIKAQIAN